MTLQPRPPRVKLGPLARAHLASLVARESAKPNKPSVSVLESALALLCAGWPRGVEWCAAEGVFEVASRSEAGRVYLLTSRNARCACAAGAAGRYCAHRAAVALFDKAAELARREEAGLLSHPSGALAPSPRAGLAELTAAHHAQNAKERREALCGTRAE